MKLDILFENFEMLSDAPNSIPKMREMILQLAIQGKLLPQDPNDEPASVLLDKINAKKERLIKEKKIKKSNPIKVLEPDEIPYKLPYKWEWTRLGNIANAIHYGYTASADDTQKEVRLLRITDIQNDSVNWETVPGCSIDQKKIPQYELNDGDLLIARTGGTVGKTYLVHNIPVCSVFASYLIRVVPTRPFLPEFLKLFSGSPHYWQQLYAKCSGTGQPNVNATSLKGITVAVPPLAEQHRIVTKVNQLLAICDKLEAQKQKRDDSRIVLNDASLDRLLSAENQKNFNINSNRVSNNFDLLYDNPENVRKLRQAILQLAVQGKLVPQDPNDEPASVLLEKIELEKERLIKKKKIKKTKSIKPIEPDAIPYELPKWWEWTKFDTICSYIQRGKGPKYVEKSNIPVISQKCIQWEGFQIERARFIDPASLEKYTEERFLRSGDLLWNSTGTGTIGRVNVYRNEDNQYEKVVADSHVTVVRPIILDSDFLWCFIASPIIQYGFEDRASGTTNQIELNTSTVKNQIIPIPPLNEQKRIVTKVDQLMSLCDELETKLSKSQNDGDELLKAIVNNNESVSGKICNNQGTAVNSNVQQTEQLPERIQVELATFASNAKNSGRTQRNKSGRGKKTKAQKTEIGDDPEPATISEPINSKETAKKTEPKKQPPSKAEGQFEKLDVLKAFRKAIFRQNGIDEFTLLRLAGQRLGVKRLSQQIREELESYLKTGVRRKILYRNDDGYSAGAPTIEYYEDDFLIKVLRSVSRKGWEYPRDYLVDEAANYLGFDKASEALRERMKSVFRKAICNKSLYRNGQYVGKI